MIYGFARLQPRLSATITQGILRKKNLPGKMKKLKMKI